MSGVLEVINGFPFYKESCELTNHNVSLWHTSINGCQEEIIISEKSVHGIAVFFFFFSVHFFWPCMTDRCTLLALKLSTLWLSVIHTPIFSIHAHVSLLYSSLIYHTLMAISATHVQLRYLRYDHIDWKHSAKGNMLSGRATCILD